MCEGPGQTDCGECEDVCPPDQCEVDLGCGCGKGRPIPCPGECGGEYCLDDGPGDCPQLLDCGPCPDVCEDDGPCQVPDCIGICGGDGCDETNNLCCPDNPSDGCTWCDPCIEFQSTEIRGNEVQSLRGNFKEHDLVPTIYINHDLNAGVDAFQADTVDYGAIGPRDTVMSCVLELTVQDVFGRVPYTGAAPFVHPLKLSVYRSKKTIDTSYVGCGKANQSDSWTDSSRGRHEDDRELTAASTITVGDDVKPGDKIYLDLTELARNAVHNSNGVMNFMVEASDWFADSTGLTPAGKQANHPSMLLKFHSEGNNGPKINTTVNQGLRPAHTRLNPAVARRRAIAGL